MVASKIVYENGRFLKIIKKDGLPEAFTYRQPSGRVDADGAPIYLEIQGFRSKEVETKKTATLFQWLTWKLFRVCL